MRFFSKSWLKTTKNYKKNRHFWWIKQTNLTKPPNVPLVGTKQGCRRKASKPTPEGCRQKLALTVRRQRKKKLKQLHYTKSDRKLFGTAPASSGGGGATREESLFRCFFLAQTAPYLLHDVEKKSWESCGGKEHFGKWSPGTKVLRCWFFGKSLE